MSRVGRLFRSLFPGSEKAAQHRSGRAASVGLSRSSPVVAVAGERVDAAAATAPDFPGSTGESGTDVAGRLPESFSHYRILSELGRGGMGVVYKAQDTRLRRLVALKFLPPDRAHGKGALERLRLEARAASALNHPNICTVYDIGECESGAFIAMEFLEGASLRQQLRRAPLAPERVTTLGIQLCDALGAAHAKGIIHRDIKPENLFITDQGRLKVLDFGIAKLQPSAGKSDAEQTTHTAETPLTMIGVPVGTLAYMSPEQAKGERVDHRTDLFSFGAALFEMACGRRAFNARTAAETHAAVLTAHPVLPGNVEPRFASALQAVLDKALEKDRDLRYQHAADVGADLKRLERDLTDTAALGEAAQPRPGMAVVGRSIAGDLLRASILGTLTFFAYGTLDQGLSGKYFRQFQVALIQENLERAPLDDGGRDLDTGVRQLPLVVDISALHPEKKKPTDRETLDVVIAELRRNGAAAIGVDLLFDDVQVTDFQYFDKWLKHQNVRLGIYERALEKREAWLGRPEFAPLAAGVALPVDNPLHAYAYSRHWLSASAPQDVSKLPPAECRSTSPAASCPEELIQLPVALWLIAEQQRVASGESSSQMPERRLRTLLDSATSPEREAAAGLDWGTYVIDYSYLKELKQRTITLPSAEPEERAGAIASHLRAYRSQIAGRVVFLGDLEDTADQACPTEGINPLPGVLIHASSFATLNRGLLLETAGALSAAAMWTFWSVVVLAVVGLRIVHTTTPFRLWPYQHLAVIVFVSLSIGVVLTTRWVAGRSGVVWPNYLWVACALAIYPFTSAFGRAFVAALKIGHMALEPFVGRQRGEVP